MDIVTNLINIALKEIEGVNIVTYILSFSGEMFGTYTERGKRGTNLE